MAVLAVSNEKWSALVLCGLPIVLATQVIAGGGQNGLEKNEMRVAGVT